ncbi:MAG: DUF72 domain-containing protein [Desulfurococcaceae archaeon]
MKFVYVGCCGFPCSRKKYFELFSVVELQNTFYDLPSVSWAEGIRREAPTEFRFAVKAWQVITHPSSSPTGRTMKKKPNGSIENYGYLRPTRENVEAFKKTVELARVLRAEVIVLQTPPTMPHSESALGWAHSFFEEVKPLVDRSAIIAWEVRGPLAYSPHLRDVFEGHDLLHVVDILKNKPIYKHSRGLLYTRLHGIGRGEVNYKYNYTEADLNKLCSAIFSEEPREAYILFNNIRMLDNALKLKSMLKSTEDLSAL